MGPAPLAQTATFLSHGWRSVPLGPRHWHWIATDHFHAPIYFRHVLTLHLTIPFLHICQSTTKHLPNRFQPQLGAAYFRRFELFCFALHPLRANRLPSGTARRTTRPSVLRSSIPPVVAAAAEMLPRPNRPRPMPCPTVSDFLI